MISDLHSLRTQLRQLAIAQGLIEAELAPSAFDARALLVRRAELVSARIRLQAEIFAAIARRC